MEKDLEYYQFVQDLADGIVSMEEPLFLLDELDEINQISSMVDSWKQVDNLTPKLDFESLMDPLLNEYKQAIKRKTTHNETSKIEIYDLIRSFAKRFQSKSQARKFFLNSKYIKNDLMIIANALDIPKSEELSTRFRIVNAILEEI